MKLTKIFIILPIMILSLFLISSCGSSDMSDQEVEEGLYPMREQDEDDNYIYGYVDETGEYVIEPRFSDALDFKDGLAVVQNQGTSLYGCIDENGEYVIDPEFRYIGPFNEGLAVASEPDSNSDQAPFGKHGYINKSGEYVIEPQYSAAYDFSHGYAAVGVEVEVADDGTGYPGTRTQYGFIDTQGNMVVDTQFTAYCAPFDESGEAIVGHSSYADPVYVNVDIEGNYTDCENPDIPGIERWDFSDGLYLNVPLYEYVDKNGETVYDCSGKTDWPGRFSEGLCATYEEYEDEELGISGFKYGFMDEKGEICIEEKFLSEDSFGDTFKNGMCYVETIPDEEGNIEYGYIDKEGNWLIKKERKDVY